MPTPTVHVIIPAHDEAALIGGTLRTLLTGAPAGALQVVVVANGCLDATAAIARTFPDVRVVELDTASKAAALAAGARTAGDLPRVHLDADCAISGADVLRLVRALDEPGVLAAAPARHLRTARSSWWVRGYYRVWERLPGVRDGLYGRGVIALSPEAQRRIDLLPPVLSEHAFPHVLADGDPKVARLRTVPLDAAGVLDGLRALAEQQVEDVLLDVGSEPGEVLRIAERVLPVLRAHDHPHHLDPIGEARVG